MGHLFKRPIAIVPVVFLLLTVGCWDRDAREKAGSSFRSDTLPGKQRHVLILTVDTLRLDYMSSEGYALPTTPELDTLLSQGIRFTHAVTPIPRTTQALASLLTGLYPHTTRVRTLLDAMPLEMIPLAQIAKHNGYSTIAVVSNHILTPKRLLDRGFDVYDFAPDIREAQATTHAAMQQLSNKQPEDAIFLWVHYIDPHVPYYPPPELVGQFDPKYDGPYKLSFGEVKGGTGQRAYPKDLPKRIAVYRNPLSDQVNEHIRKLYAADIRAVDIGIHELLLWLKLHLGDDWLIIFSSDHGESLGEHNFFYDHGDYVYNATLRVPLAFIFPKGSPLRRSGAVHDWVSLVDVAPTIVDLLDFDLPPNLSYPFEGKSLMPYLLGESVPDRPVFAECGRSYFPDMINRRVLFNVAGRFRAVIYDEWKLIWTPYQTADKEYELYNVGNDPHETQNLYSSTHPAVDDLKEMLESWTRDEGKASLAPISEEEQERLRSLGYIDD